jgi:hypothetical protein
VFAVGVILAGAGVLAGCGAVEPDATELDEDAASHVDQLDTAALDRLRSLPYLSSTSATDTSLTGVTVHDPARTQSGYNLYTVRSERAAVLTDLDGTVLRRWQADGEGHWARSLLLDNGDLLAVGAEGRDRYLARYSWGGALLWQQSLRIHHDVVVRADGTMLALGLAQRREPDLYPDHRVQDNPIFKLSAEGALLEQRSLFDLVRADPARFPLMLISAIDDRAAVDIFHANSVRPMNLPELAGSHPVYGPDNVVVSIRHQDRILIFDWETGALVWAWGHEELSGPHDAAILPTGNLLIFDNGLARGWSRVVEVDPRTDAIVWEYADPDPTAFFTASRGASQRLDNGNTLITESDSGRAFEVAPDGEIVWEYWVPLPSGGDAAAAGRRPTIVRLYRYGGAWLEALLGGGD